MPENLINNDAKETTVIMYIVICRSVNSGVRTAMFY